MRRDQDAGAVRCSFCHKSLDSVQKLISSPSDDPRRAYICDECVAVCASIIEDDRSLRDTSVLDAESDELHPHLHHRLTQQLLEAVELWIEKESLGVDAVEEFAQVRAAAVRLMRP